MTNDPANIPSKLFLVKWIGAFLVTFIFIFVGGMLIFLLDSVYYVRWIEWFGYSLVIIAQSIVLRSENLIYKFWLICGLAILVIGLVTYQDNFVRTYVASVVVVYPILLITALIQYLYLLKYFYRSYLWFFGSVLGIFLSVVALYRIQYIGFLYFDMSAIDRLFMLFLSFFLAGILYSLIPGIFLKMVLSRPRNNMKLTEIK